MKVFRRDGSRIDNDSWRSMKERGMNWGCVGFTKDGRPIVIFDTLQQYERTIGRVEHDDLLMDAEKRFFNRPD